MKWQTRDEVSQLYLLLTDWKPVSRHTFSLSSALTPIYTSTSTILLLLPLLPLLLLLLLLAPPGVYPNLPGVAGL